MQEMLLNIESIESKTTNQEQLYMLTSLKVYAMGLLEKEKEQITNAHIEGQRVFDKYHHTQWTNDQADNYYNQTYNQNK